MLMYKLLFCMHIVNILSFLGQGSKVEQFVTDWLYPVYIYLKTKTLTSRNQHKILSLLSISFVYLFFYIYYFKYIYTGQSIQLHYSSMVPCYKVNI